MERAMVVLVLLMPVGCKTSEQYQKDMASYNKANQEWNQDNGHSQQAWAEATGNRVFGGTPIKKPERPNPFEYW